MAFGAKPGAATHMLGLPGWISSMSSSSISPAQRVTIRRADQCNDLVQRVERYSGRAEMWARSFAAQPVGGAPHNDVRLVVSVIADQLVQPQRAGF